MTLAPEMAHGLATFPPEPKAPDGNARSFFVADKNTYPDHSELKELIDPLTGLPYPLVPDERRLPLHNGYVANWHHGVHPRGHEVLRTMGGRAMRSAQLQLVAVEQHNYGAEAFHNLKLGPYILRETGHQLGMCIMAAVGYRHSSGLEVSNGELWVRPLSRAQQEQLTLRAEPQRVEPWKAALYGKFYGIETQEESEAALAQVYRQQANMYYRNMHYGYDPIRNFITSVMFQQDLSNVKRQVRRRFVRRGETEKGLELMAIAAEEVASTTITYSGLTLRELYGSLHRAGRINPAMPPNVAEILKHKLGNLDTRRSLVPVFRNKLASQEEAA